MHDADCPVENTDNTQNNVARKSTTAQEKGLRAHDGCLSAPPPCAQVLTNMMNKISHMMMCCVVIIGLMAAETPAAPRTLVFATLDAPPYFGENLPDGGFYTELSREAFQRVGYTLEVEFMAWNRALELARQGDYDGMLGMYYTEQRTNDFIYTEPIYDDEIVFFSRKGETITYTTLRDLTPYTIGVLLGAAEIENLKQEGLTFIEASGQDINVKNLMAKRIDLVICSRAYLLHVITTQFPEWTEEIDVVQPPYTIEKLHNVISKNVTDAATIVADFNRGLQMIKDDGTFDRILQKHGFGKE
jgi:polar amino acid transport system substrate-binding protein